MERFHWKLFNLECSPWAGCGLSQSACSTSSHLVLYLDGGGLSAIHKCLHENHASPSLHATRDFLRA